MNTYKGKKIGIVRWLHIYFSVDNEGILKLEHNELERSSMGCTDSKLEDVTEDQVKEIIKEASIERSVG